MLENNIKQLIGELTFQLAVAQTKITDLENQLTAAMQPKEKMATLSETTERKK